MKTDVALKNGGVPLSGCSRYVCVNMCLGMYLELAVHTYCGTGGVLVTDGLWWWMI